MRIKETLIAVGFAGALLGFVSPAAQAGPGPVNPTVVVFSSVSIKVSWGLPGVTSGYVLDASTDSAFTPVRVSSYGYKTSISSLTVGSLTGNTTYYLRVGALYAGSTTYAPILTTTQVTLSSTVFGVQIIQSTTTAITVQWNSLGGNNAKGYMVQASTASNFTGVLFSVTAPSVSQTSATITGLNSGTLYNLRVGGLNWMNVANYVNVGSTVTPGATVPSGLNGASIGISSITWVWGSVSGASYYTLYQATSPTTVVANFVSQNNYSELNLSTNTLYSRMVTATVSGTESGLSAPTTAYTLAATPGQPSFSFIGVSSLTITWSSQGNPSNTPYEVNQATHPSFSTGVSSPITLAANFTATTTAFFNLSPATTYYYRIRAANSVNTLTPYSPISSVGTTVLTSSAIPVGLAGTTLGVSSITWSWTAVPSATGYKVYMATSPTTLVASVGATPNYTEIGLSTNTAYGRMVTSIVSAVESGLSASATTYTLAAIPGTPTFSNVFQSSVTVSWTAQGNPGNTYYEVTMSSVASFSAFTLPVSLAANFTATTTTFDNLSPATTYYVRVRGYNSDYIPGGNSASNFVLTAGVPGSGTGSGVGSASILPLNVTQGGIVTTTITYTVPASGMAPGGRLQIDMPVGWGPYLQTGNPGQNGYVMVTSTATNNFVVTPIYSSGVLVNLYAGFVPAGTKIQIAFQSLYSNCANAAGQNQAVWGLKSAMGSVDTANSIATAPVQTLVAGAARWLTYNPWNPITVAANSASSGLVIQASDSCGQPAVLASPLLVTLNALQSDQYTADGTAIFSANSSMSPSTTSVTIPAGSSSTVYYYQTATVGNNLWIRGDYASPFDSSAQSIWRPVNVIAGTFSFGTPSVDSGANSVVQTTMTLTPDGDGINDFAYIRFNPSDTNLQWRVTISSNGFQDNVFDRWGSGNPQSSLSWDGRSFWNGSIVPNGAYTVKLEVGGLTSNTSLTINVNSIQISGNVTLGGAPVAGAYINAQSNSGPGYSFAQTDTNGNYVLNGLKSGSVYNLFANVISTTTQAQLHGQINNVTAPASGKNFAFSNPGILRIAAVAPSTAAATSFGSVNIYDASYTQNFWGNLRLLAGTTTSDNGDSFNSSTWTILGVTPGTYTLHINMQGYAAPDQTVFVGANQTVDKLFTLLGRANIYGKVTLPVAPAVYSWVSIQGTPVGSNYPTVYGGASLSPGTTSAIYNIYGVSAGTYSFVAQYQGYAPLKTSNVIIGGTDIGDPVNGGLDFSGFSIGGKITGTLTINGDTTASANPMSIWISAFSPQLGQNAFTQLQVPTDTNQQIINYSIGGLTDGSYQIYPPYLSGFSAAPPGPQTVTVAASTGTLNIVLNQNTGKILGVVTLPSGRSDYDQVHLSLQGPISMEMNLSPVPNYSLTQLQTGLYTLVATYQATGAQVRVNIALTNGQTQTINLDLSAATHALSGTVSVQSGFTMLDPTLTPVTVNTITDLLANATQQTLTIGGMAMNTPTLGNQCMGGTSQIVTTARVEAFPKEFNSYGQANRSGFNNCFGVGQYKFGTIAADGTYSIEGLTPGIWEVDVYPYFDNGNTPNVSVTKRLVTILSVDVSSVNFALSNGNSVSGTINLPAGVTDTRTLNLQVVTDRGDSVQTTVVQLGSVGNPAASAAFSLSHLDAGNYSLVVQDPGTFDPILLKNITKYKAQPVQFQITGGDVTGVTLTLSNASRIVGKLVVQGSNPDGTPSRTLITSANESLLPDNFRISAQANPWVPSGYADATRQSNGSKVDINADNQFTIDGLIAGTYDVMFQQDSFGGATQSQGSLNIAAYTQGGVTVTQGQTLDLGTITLQPGLTLSGIVTNTNGTPLSNIPVRAQPSNNQHGQNSQQTYTDSAGVFTFSGLSPAIKIYDFTAAPRPHPGDNVQAVPYGQIKKLAVDVTRVPAPTLNFSLPSAVAGFTGRVVTADGGALSYPNGDQSQKGFPAAAIFVNQEGSNDSDNPLGDDNASELDGTFTITNLPAGVYNLTIESLGYRPVRISTITLTTLTRDLGTITLQRGPSLTATLAKPDGSAVNTNDVRQAVAVNADLSSIIFGQINSDAQTNNILSIKFSGFELTPKTYSVLLFDTRDNMIIPPDGKNLIFLTNSDTLTRALTFQPTAPQAIANIQKSGTDVLITLYLSRPLRNGAGDQDPTAWLTVTSGSGQLSARTLSGDRRQYKAVYTPSASEQNATLAFSAHTVDIDPGTGVEYPITKTLTLLLGQKATAEQSINAALGGQVSLSDSLDPSKVSIQGNSLLNTNGTTADATTTYAFTLSATDDAANAGATALVGAARVTGMMARGPGAYLSEAYSAMRAARAQATINPLSSFYSVLLPAGISHSLIQTATLTLNYDTTADPALINVYFYNGVEYLIEQNNRVVDTVNHTISVGVSHFSTFVVLENNQPVVEVNGDATSGADIAVFNFPNPFNLQSKTPTLVHGGGSAITTEGTIIRYTIPAALNGNTHIDIYNIIGEKVRTINLGVPSADTFNYVEWDGRNNSGKKVASGVYIGELKVGGAKKFFKMAVIK